MSTPPMIPYTGSDKVKVGELASQTTHRGAGVGLQFCMIHALCREKRNQLNPNGDTWTHKWLTSPADLCSLGTNGLISLWECERVSPSWVWLAARTNTRASASCCNRLTSLREACRVRGMPIRKCSLTLYQLGSLVSNLQFFF